MQSKSALLGTWIFILALAFPLCMSARPKTKKPVLSPTAKAGQRVFNENCNVCHNARQTATKIGPGLKGLFKAKVLPYSHKPVTDASVRTQIEKGNPDATPMPMPSFGSALSQKDIDNVIAYLKTL